MKVQFVVQVWYSTPTNERLAQPVTWRDQPISTVIQLLFKLGVEYHTWAQFASSMISENVYLTRDTRSPVIGQGKCWWRAKLYQPPGAATSRYTNESWDELYHFTLTTFYTMSMLWMHATFQMSMNRWMVKSVAISQLIACLFLLFVV